jgi:hypothetical protein
MAFVKRGLRFVIDLNTGENADSSAPETFDNGTTGLTLDGIRSTASIESIRGGDSAFGSSALVQLWGMKPSDMAQLSTLGFNQNRYNKNTVKVFAYNQGNAANAVEVFWGSIFSARINYNAMPDVSMELECYATLNQQMQVVSGTSVQGSGDVATMLQGICAACDPPVPFVNKGVSAKLSNPAYSGSAWQQMSSICCDAAVCHKLEGGTFTIWDRDQTIDDTVIETGPDNGMVGYPEYDQMGLNVTMEFNPEVLLGRQLMIKKPSAANSPPVPGVPSTFYINMVTHDLSCEMPDGPWFTRASVSKTQLAAFH